ncbi:PH domain-containing protein [Pseudonocardia sp. RS11V-5]|uniref:PH domain-containing protein n=1 Tax=Pseudonocardia terrae TaxID=2905831 RepID=UPI001E4BF7AC|nr:PH domain-containing protein [Pseudonocardia terrae]MCE3552429.1 PH domain-containing protein [Pseudonocardia terrae]
MTVSADPADPTLDTEVPWRRLDLRMVVVEPVRTLVKFVPVLIVVLITGSNNDPVRPWVTLGIGVLVVVAGVVRWRTTRYRITAERVELHSGWLRRQRRSVPRDRIRTVDLTASPLHRAFRLSVVAVRAAESGGEHRHGGLTLDAVSTAEAETLRRELLDRRPAETRSTPVAQPVEPEAEVLARLHWSWLRFAPLTFSSLAGIGAIAAAGFNVLNELGVNPTDVGGVDAAAERLAAAPLWLAVGLVGLALLVVAVIGSLLLFTERWWGYRLTRETDGTLRVRRGLFTTRSLSVAEERLRGVGVHEPLLLRAGGGAQTRALSTGLGREAQGGVLQPPAPRAEAHRVAGAALRRTPDAAEADPTLTPLLPHPSAARRRRYTRALLPVLVLVAAAAVVGRAWPGLGWIWPGTVVLVPLAALLAADRYRALGHALTPRHLVSRLGGLSRRTVALQRAGVIGWTVRQSPLQRRAGLVTLQAVTAAGEGGYRILDIGAADAVALAEATTPGLLPRTDGGPARPTAGDDLTDAASAPRRHA